ncbi:MAG: DUF421 domain-containing protein [Capnocytophaga sp.]|nr:DUF421 domain-containing protein [Capnocytophaga sp.]
MNAYLEIIIRSLVVYLFIVMGLRLFGKNQLSQLNAGDIVLLLLISNAVQNAMVGENTSLEGGLLAAFVLFLVNLLLKKFMLHNAKIKQLVEGKPEILVRDGIADLSKMKTEEISMEELEESIREHGVESIKSVKLAILEVDGNISIIATDHNEQTQFYRNRRKHVKKSRKF